MQGYDNLSCIFDSNAQQKLYGSMGKSCLIKRECWDADASCADTDAVVGDAMYSKCKPFCCIEVAPGRPDICVKLAPMEKCSNKILKATGKTFEPYRVYLRPLRDKLRTTHREIEQHLNYFV